MTIARRNTQMNFTLANTAWRRGIPWIRFAGGQVTAGTGITGLHTVGTKPVTQGKIGESTGSKELFITGLGINATADAFGVLLSAAEIWDVDFSAAIYFDWLIFCKAGMTAASDKLDWAMKYGAMPQTPAGAADVSTDNIAAMTANSTQLVVVAASLESLTTQSGAYLAANTLSDHEKGLYVQGVPTVTTASDNEFVVVGLEMRYTRRF